MVRPIDVFNEYDDSLKGKYKVNNCAYNIIAFDIKTYYCEAIITKTDKTKIRKTVKINRKSIND